MINLLWKASRGVRAAIVANILCGIISVGLGLGAVWLTREIVDDACAARIDQLKTHCLLLCAALLAQLLVQKSAQRIETWSDTRFSARLRERLFATILGGRHDGNSDLHSADIVNRLSSDVDTVATAACSTLPSTVVAAASLVGSFIFLVSIAPVVAVVVTALMPVAIISGKLSMKKSHRLTREIRDQQTAVARMMQEDMSHRLLVATLGYVGKAADDFRNEQGRFYRLVMKRNDLGLLAGGTVAFGFMAGYAVMFIYCAFGLADGSVSFATMTALLQLVAMVQRPAVNLSHKFSPMVRASVSAERLRKLETLYAGDGTATPAVIPGGAIRFDDVWFRYGDGDDYVLRGFTESLPAGKVTTVYGATGAGKTTLFRLLLGLYSPRRGRVEAPFAIGVDNVVYVPQGNTLMSGTIMTNLLMGKPDASRGEIAEALHTACCGFVDDLPQGLSTPVGELGHGLSEGQAQRLAIARGLLRFMAIREAGKPNVVVLLDEPTSALDSTTEQTLCERLTAMLRGSTVVIITHKSTPGRFSDKEIRL